MAVTPSSVCTMPSTIRNGASTSVSLLLVVEIGPHDDVGDAGFVLEREEHEPFGRARPLARDDHAGRAHAPARAHAWQLDRGHDAAHRQLVAAERHRVRADGQAGAGVVGDEALARGHRF